MEAKTESNIKEWLHGNYDADVKNEIRRLQQESPSELEDAFYKDLEFGTGGLRGIMGVGTNRMNKYTIGKATQGYANYLKQNFEKVKVAIAFDSRNHSKEFAQIVAEIFAANDIQVYLFESLRPTPELSFTIRTLGCQGGVVLTASHNPKEYNGYKAYWDDGAQMVPPHDKNVITEVEKIKNIAKRYPPESIFGPMPSPIPKLRGFYRWQILLKDQDINYADFEQNDDVKIEIDVDPVNMY